MAPDTRCLILLILCYAGTLAHDYGNPPPPNPWNPPNPPPPKPWNPHNPPPPPWNPPPPKPWNPHNHPPPPPKEKPGTCPAQWSKCTGRMKPGRCKYDQDCPSNLKCCSIDCVTECVSVKPGNCPTVNTFAPCTKPYSVVKCKDDYSCPGRQRCCDIGCRMLCSDTV
ncbi:WAP four-disulfide core domain protein 5-like isoform X3 [Ranitomeya imitator]|uniref:WAP four-disulfide core domain protein 5-like isoform X3 n=1 Tax=Ranitomeya imitator TaxID=111125 RepID=UPI0037E88DB6